MTNHNRNTLFNPPHNGKQTSRQAAQAINPTTKIMREQVYNCLANAGSHGLTDLQVQELLNMDGSTQRPRRGELRKTGRIACVGSAVRSPSQRLANVWVISELATQARANMDKVHESEVK